MTRFLTYLRSALVVSAVISAVPALAQQQAGTVLKDTHGDWEVHCIQGTDACLMRQVGKTSNDERALIVSIQRLAGVQAQDGTQVPALISTLAPLGVLLPYGLRVKIDGGDTAGLPFERCLSAGCAVQAPMRDQTIDKMKAGSTATFTFAIDREIDVNVSLRGFTKAFNSLTPVDPKQQR